MPTADGKLADLGCCHGRMQRSCMSSGSVFMAVQVLCSQRQLYGSLTRRPSWIKPAGEAMDDMYMAT